MKLAQIPKIYTMANAAQANKEQAVNSEQKKDQSKGNKMKRKTNTKKRRKEKEEKEKKNVESRKQQSTNWKAIQIKLRGCAASLFKRVCECTRVCVCVCLCICVGVGCAFVGYIIYKRPSGALIMWHKISKWHSFIHKVNNVAKCLTMSSLTLSPSLPVSLSFPLSCGKMHKTDQHEGP